MIVETTTGRFRLVAGRHPDPGVLFECPGCGEWLPITREMLMGRVSMDHASDGCKGGFHETRDLGSALVTSLTISELEALARG